MQSSENSADIVPAGQSQRHPDPAALPEVPTEVPTEVLVARVIRAHSEALAAYAVLAAVLAFLAMAGSMMAANFSETPTYQGGVYGAMVALSAVVIAAATCGWGLVSALRMPTDTQDTTVRETVLQLFDRSQHALHWFSRLVLVAIIIGIAAAALFWLPGIIGVLIGAVALAHVWAMSRYIMSRCFIATTQLTPAGSRIIPGLERLKRN